MYFEDFFPQVYLGLFAQDSGRATCALAANILVKTLDDASIEAYSYDFGFEGSDLTHVLVIARSESALWSVHDPFFNYSVVDEQGRPKDFFALVRALHEGNLADVKTIGDTVWRTVLIDPKSDYDLNPSCIEQVSSAIRTTHLPNQFSRPVCFDCRIGGEMCPELDFMSRMEDRLKAEGLPPFFLLAMLKPINKVWGPDAESFQALVDSAFRSLGLPSR